MAQFTKTKTTLELVLYINTHSKLNWTLFIPKIKQRFRWTLRMYFHTGRFFFRFIYSNRWNWTWTKIKTKDCESFFISCHRPLQVYFLIPLYMVDLIQRRYISTDRTEKINEITAGYFKICMQLCWAIVSRPMSFQEHTHDK